VTTVGSTTLSAGDVTTYPVAATAGYAVNAPVATFDPSRADTTTAHYTASIAWSDGSTESASLSDNGDGTFDVASSHTFADPGSYSGTLTITHTATGVYSTAALAATVKAPLDFTMTGTSVSATEGQTFSNTPIATLTTNDPTASPDQFAASVDWGDGNSADTTATFTSLGNGVFAVKGSHTYLHPGSDSIAVNVTAPAAPNDPTADASATATVGNAAWNLNLATVNAREGKIWTGTLGTFTDANPFAKATDFTATTDWLVGSVTPAGSPIITRISPGVFRVTGSAEFTDDVPATLKLSVTESSTNREIDNTEDVIILKSTMSVTGNSLVSPKPNEGEQTAMLVLGTITDTNKDAPRPTAQVTFFDNAQTVDAEVDDTDVKGTWVVKAAHKFSQPGRQMFSIFAHRGDHSNFGMGSVEVKPAPISQGPDHDDPAITGNLDSGWSVPTSTILTSFTSTHTALGDFTAVVHWADGTTSDGNVAPVSGDPHSFDITGGHDYDKMYIAIIAAQPVAPLWAEVWEQGLLVGYVGGSVRLYDDRPNEDHPEGDVNAERTPVDAYPPDMPTGDEDQGAAGGGEEHGGDTGNDAPVNDDANGELEGTHVDLTVNEGDSLGGETIATFTDGAAAEDPDLSIDSYTATSTYDGQTFDCEIVDNGGGNYGVVMPEGAYAGEEAKYTKAISVTISADATEANDARSITVGSSVRVNDAPLTGIDVDRIKLGSSKTVDQVVGRFSDAYAAAPLSDFTATIDWGDGTVTEGSISKVEGEDGLFQVAGTHAYDPSTRHDEGSHEILDDAGNIIGYPIVVTVKDKGGATTECGTSVDVNGAGLESLTVRDADHPTNSVTDTDAGNPPDLYVLENQGIAHVELIPRVYTDDTDLSRYSFYVEPPADGVAPAKFGNFNTDTIALTLAPEARHQYVIDIGLDKNDDQRLTGDEVQRQVIVHLVTLGNLTAQDDSNPANQITVTGVADASKRLIVVADGSNNPSIWLTQDVQPVFEIGAYSQTLFSVTSLDGTAPEQDGNFGDEPEVTLNAALSQSFKVQVGFDANNDGTLQAAEVTRSASVYVVHIGDATLTDLHGNGLNNVTAADGTAKDLYVFHDLNTSLLQQLAIPAASGITGQRLLWNLSGTNWFDFGNFGSGNTVPISRGPMGQTDYVVTIAYDANGNGRMDEPILRTIKVHVLKPQIDVLSVLKDDPSASNFTITQTDSNGNPAVYGGSEASTSDVLKLAVRNSPFAMVPTSYTWTVTGSGWQNYAAATALAQSGVLDLAQIWATPGTLTFSVRETFLDGQALTVTQQVDVGIRTDDAIVVGWIDPNGFNNPLSTTGVHPDVDNTFPPGGPSTLDTLGRVRALWALELLADGNDQFYAYPNGTQVAVAMNAADNKYMLDWLFKYGGNLDPASALANGDFRNATGLDRAKVLAFWSDPTNYKLWNELQIRYLVGSNGFAEPPHVIHQGARVGTTVNPLAVGGDWLTWVSWPLGNRFLFPGQNGPALSFTPNVDAIHVSSIVDGSPDPMGIAPYQTVANALVGKWWENIGDKIEFLNQGVGGDYTKPKVTFQNYPTYNVYLNGSLSNLSVAQPLDPLQHFYINPYPWGLGGGTEHVSARNPTARVPAYTVP
jgi:hypothetical protein